VLHLLGNGQARDDVASRASGHDDQVAGGHARPPRMG
jgi:hypothetical protein